uniref:KIB1-4 beta-propeller domain-containing protein n=1 Tax=Arundo donax TaxID=35708 RepID=A0A0A9A1J8_ARUDO
MNPLSGATLPLPKLASAVHLALDKSKYYNQSYIRKTHVKVVLSSPLDSTSDPLVAVLIMEGNGVAVSSCKKHDAITITISLDPPRIYDIAFLHGKLYALTEYEGLHVVELNAGRLSTPKSSSGFHQCIVDDPKQQEIYNSYQHRKHYHGIATYSEYLVLRYLAESDGRLLMIRRWMSLPWNARLGDHDRTFLFEVFEADLTTFPGRWTEVDSLCGQAVFLVQNAPNQSLLANVQVEFKRIASTSCIEFSTIHPKSTSVHVWILLPTLACAT